MTPSPMKKCMHSDGGFASPPEEDLASLQVMFMTKRRVALALGFLLGMAAQAAVVHDADQKTVLMTDGTATLTLRLNYAGRCVCDQVIVRGREVVSPPQAVFSAIQTGATWHTTKSGLPEPRVTVHDGQVEVTDIRFGGGGVKVTETWRFEVQSDRILWTIEREYPAAGTLDDIATPAWEFKDMQTWTGALLGHGGVAWNRLFDAPNAGYGVHTGPVTFWSKEHGDCLRIEPTVSSRLHVAARFHRLPEGGFALGYSVSERERTTKHGLSRFLRDRADVWAALPVAPGKVTVTYALSAPDYRAAYDRGTFKHFDGAAIREIAHSIARIGAVDRHLHGSNGYYSDCAVLHEPWIAQLGLLIDDPAYFRAYADTLDFEREHAIAPDGRVKSRWAGTPGDAMPGTYDAEGFYEAQWGYLMDSQPSWVINVAELFDFTADRPWLERQKSTCERVLDYQLRRDADGDGLLEMMTASHQEARGSDWIDVVWAAHENALVNAQMFWALTRWAELEEWLGDAAHATRYSQAAHKLQQRFNQSTSEGGFWDPAAGCYAYWRDRDDSIHGTNLVVPVQFAAIGYGVCADRARQTTVLNRIEALMKEERLFCWPLCFFPYAAGEAHASQYPFPTYENGDIFLAWGELGTRCYAALDPALPLKYVRNVLDQYAKDGLAFQRYLRKPQTGTGADILANNSSIVVGLYRNLYGVQPKHDRLLLDPHLSPELNGTQLKYWLRDQTYVIDLNMDGCRVAVDGVRVKAPTPFAVRVEPTTAAYFADDRKTASLRVARASGAPLELNVEAWSHQAGVGRRWTELGAPGPVRQVVSDLAPNQPYLLRIDDLPARKLGSNASGEVAFECELHAGATHRFVLEAAPEPAAGSR